MIKRKICIFSVDFQVNNITIQKKIFALIPLSRALSHNVIKIGKAKGKRNKGEGFLLIFLMHIRKAE